ncbi:unnamed protein product [Allacma fusca]|uniref:Uncharacterized protein n=1 Tax=Allacma fusca TaxID=39272 RepID=A0A8J2PF09_9HEXA|nr:unnamed protein product [Allacma fusca]
MSRSQVIASVNEQELRRDSTPDLDCTDFVIVSSSPQLQELELTASSNIPKCGNPQGREPETGEEPETGGETDPGGETKTSVVHESVTELMKPLDSPGPTIHQIIQIMRKKIQQARSSKANGHPLVVTQSIISESVSEVSENQNVIPALGNIQISVIIQNAGSSSDQPTFRSVASLSSSVLTQARRHSQLVPSLDSVIAACIGHGPPFTSWQMCQIYNSCTESESNMSLSDLKGLLPQIQFSVDY